MMLIIILLILIGLTSYAAFKCYHYYDDPYSLTILLLGLLIEIVGLLRAVAIELNLITIT